MYTRTKYVGRVLPLAVVLLLAGCDPDMNTNPILPGQTAVLSITFESNPVYEGYNDTYSFLVYIDERNGVGANIGSVKIEYIDDKGDVWETDNWNSNDVVRTFGTNRIDSWPMSRSKIASFATGKTGWCALMTTWALMSNTPAPLSFFHDKACET